MRGGGDKNRFTLEKNLVEFMIGKMDWDLISNGFVIFPRIGFHFDDFGHEPGNAVVTQSGGDICPVAVRVDRTQNHAGVQFVNGQFMSTREVGPENRGPVKLTNCGFWGDGRHARTRPPPRTQLAGVDGVPFHRLGSRPEGRALPPGGRGLWRSVQRSDYRTF